MKRGFFQKLKTRWGHASLRVKMLISVFLGSVLLVVGSTAFFFARYTGLSQENSRRQFSELCAQGEVNLNTMFSAVENNGIYILNSTELLSVFRHLAQSSYPLSQAIDDYFSISRVTSRYYVNKSTRAIRYYFNTDAIYTRERSTIFPLSEISGEAWYERMLIAKGSPFWVYLPEKKHFSCFQAVYKNVQTGELLGVLEQELEQEEILKVLKSISAFSLDCTVLTDHSGIPVCSVGEDVETFLERDMDLDAAKENGLYTGAKDLCFSSRLDNLFILAGRFSSPQLALQMNMPVVESLLFCVIALISAALLAGLVSKSLSRRINRIAAGVDHIRPDSREYLPVTYDDEITKIELAINRLLEAIRAAFQENERIHNQKKQADFRVLQEQINPHFLYNCLDSINWMALRNKEYQIARMAQLLGRFFRMSLSHGNQMIPLADELEHVRIYLDIMQIRFENWIQVHWEAEKSALDRSVLKLLLQPLVENAVLHGFNGQKMENKSLSIRIRFSEEKLCFTISDNGMGMSAERLREIEKVLEEEKRPKSSFGLWNTNQRLVLYYGKEAHLRIKSELGKGTTVEFTLSPTALEDKGA